MLNDLDALRLALPGVAKCQPLSADDVETISRKAELRDLVARLGISKRRAASKLRIDESTLRGLMKPQALDRRPSDHVLDRARDLVEAHALRASAQKLETA